MRFDTDELAESAEDLLEALRDATGETAALATADLKRRDGEVVLSLTGRQGFNFRAEAGHRFPLHCTGPGKAFLCALADRRLQRVVRSLRLARHTRNTHTDADALLADLRASGKRGYAFDLEEIVDSLVCIGAPVVVRRQPVAAIWITFPAFRIERSRYDELGLLVRETADRVARRLEGREYDPGRHNAWVVSQAKTYLQEHAHEAVDLAALARRLHAGYCWFHRSFQRAVGVGPKQYHSALRLAKAARLLRCTRLPVNEIAFRLGYPTPDYFSAAFKAKRGVSPLQYRRDASPAPARGTPRPSGRGAAAGAAPAARGSARRPSARRSRG